MAIELTGGPDGLNPGSAAPNPAGPAATAGVPLAPVLLGVGLLGLLGLFALLRSWSAREPMADDALPAQLVPAPIDGERAYGYLKQICALGPRPAGSEANTRQRLLVAEHFRKCGATVREQAFVAFDPLKKADGSFRQPFDPVQPGDQLKVSMANLIGSWFPERTRRVVIAAHYDTRPFPDQETDPRRRNAPFIGANDGASGVALLMELANHLKDSPTEWGVDLVLFDGEELVYDRVGEYFLGSKEFGRQYKADRRAGKYTYAAGILLDMVAGKNLQLPREPYSARFAGGLLRDIWAVARKLDAPAFVDQAGREVLDDHLAMNDAGIPTVDLIDFNYPQWHTADDTPEFCSGASLQQVGRVVSAWLNKPAPASTRRQR